MNNVSSDSVNQGKGLPVDLIQLFLENQKKELEVRAQELEIAKQEESHNYDVTKLSVRTQADNFEKDRDNTLNLFLSVLPHCGQIHL